MSVYPSAIHLLCGERLKNKQRFFMLQKEAEQYGEGV